MANDRLQKEMEAKANEMAKAGKDKGGESQESVVAASDSFGGQLCMRANNKYCYNTIIIPSWL